jgi:hypothetical protein
VALADARVRAFISGTKPEPLTEAAHA